jgi:hypothetical protein
MTLSLSEGLPAGVCVNEDGLAQMAMHGAHADASAMPDHGVPTPDRESDGGNCPMGAAMATCVATAVVVTLPVVVPTTPVSSLAIVPQNTLVPVSFVVLGLFRPPIS